MHVLVVLHLLYFLWQVSYYAIRKHYHGKLEYTLYKKINTQIYNYFLFE